MPAITMRNFDLSKLTPIRAFSPSGITRLRRRDKASVDEFAFVLGVTPRLVKRWESGQSVPFSAALKALNLVRVRGLDYLK